MHNRCSAKYRKSPYLWAKKSEKGISSNITSEELYSTYFCFSLRWLMIVFNSFMQQTVTLVTVQQPMGSKTVMMHIKWTAEKVLKVQFQWTLTKSDINNDHNLMLGVCLSIKTNYLIGRNISLFTVFNLCSLLIIHMSIHVQLHSCYSHYKHKSLEIDT